MEIESSQVLSNPATHDEKPEAPHIDFGAASYATQSAILEVLMHGLQLSSRIYNDLCADALLAIGPKCLEPLHQRILSEKLADRHPSRLVKSANRIRRAKQAPVSSDDNILEALLGGLRLPSKQLNTLAADVLVRLGPAISSKLVFKAFFYCNSPGYAVRILEVVEDTVESLSSDDAEFLSIMAEHNKNADLVQAAARVIARCGEEFVEGQQMEPAIAAP